MKSSSIPFFSRTKHFYCSLLSAALLLHATTPKVEAQQSGGTAYAPDGSAYYGPCPSKSERRTRSYVKPDGSTHTWKEDCSGEDWAATAEQTQDSTYVTTQDACQLSSKCCRNGAPPEPPSFCPTNQLAAAPNATNTHLLELLGPDPITTQTAQGPVQIWGPEGTTTLTPEHRALGTGIVEAIIIGSAIGVFIGICKWPKKECEDGCRDDNGHWVRDCAQQPSNSSYRWCTSCSDCPALGS